VLLTGHLLFYTSDATQPDREWVVHGVDGDRTSTTVHRLSPLTTYYFKVQSRTAVGYGPLCPPVNFRTPACKCYTVPLMVYVVVKYSHSRFISCFMTWFRDTCINVIQNKK